MKINTPQTEQGLNNFLALTKKKLVLPNNDTKKNLPLLKAEKPKSEVLLKSISMSLYYRHTPQIPFFKILKFTTYRIGAFILTLFNKRQISKILSRKKQEFKIKKAIIRGKIFWFVQKMKVRKINYCLNKKIKKMRKICK